MSIPRPASGEANRPLAEVVEALAAHSTWANRRLLDAASAISAERFRTVEHPSFGSLRGALVHLVDVQRVCLARARASSVPPALDPSAFPDLASLRAAWEPLAAETRSFVAGLDEPALARIVRYVDAQGEPNAYPLWQILVHQATHAAQHRSELALLLTQLGHSPGGLDFLVFVDEMAATEPAPGGTREAAGSPPAADLRQVEAGYEAVAAAYADHFRGELSHKPFDRHWLDRLAALAADVGPLCDLGCGPGHAAGYLHAGGAGVFGADLSPAMLREARRLYPGIGFERQDMLALTIPAESLGGILAFYAIVHFTLDQVEAALRECWRVLRPGGFLLLAFHVGDGARHVDELLGHPVSLDFVFFRPDDVVARLAAARFEVAEVTIRYPYPDVEYPSQRAYVLARKPSRPDRVGEGGRHGATAFAP